MSDRRNRRQFLSAIGSMGALSITGTVAAQRRSHGSHSKGQPVGVGSVDNEQGLPIAAQGKSTHTFVPDGDYVVHRHRFESRDLAERYGDPVFEFEPERIERERLPSDLQDGSRITVEDERVIGTIAEQANSEDKIWNESSGDRQVSAQHHLDDRIPLHHYEEESDAQNRVDRKAPINVVWTVSSASEAQDHYYDDCNWTRNPIQPDNDRYIIYDNETQSHDLRIQKTLTSGDDGWVFIEGVPIPLDVYEQIDIRVYNIGDSSYPVIGQAHIDPWDHNQDCAKLGIGCRDWHFNAARDAAVSCWESESGNWGYTHSLAYEKDYDTHDGKIGIMY